MSDTTKPHHFGSARVMTEEEKAFRDAHFTRTDNSKVIAELQAKNDALFARVAQLSDLCRFMCQTWTAIDSFVYENCDSHAIGKYPVVQGTQNQFNLNKIGEQEFYPENINSAVEYLIHQQGKDQCPG